MSPPDEKATRTRAGGIFLLLWSPVIYFLCDGYVFSGTDLDVRWILAVFVPVAIAMILFPHVSWLQKD